MIIYRQNQEIKDLFEDLRILGLPVISKKVSGCPKEIKPDFVQVNEEKEELLFKLSGKQVIKLTSKHFLYEVPLIGCAKGYMVGKKNCNRILCMLLWPYSCTTLNT